MSKDDLNKSKNKGFKKDEKNSKFSKDKFMSNNDSKNRSSNSSNS